MQDIRSVAKEEKVAKNKKGKADAKIANGNKTAKKAITAVTSAKKNDDDRHGREENPAVAKQHRLRRSTWRSGKSS